MRLFLTELNRFWRRRLTWITTAIMIALITLITVIVFVSSSNDPGERDRAVEEAAENTATCKEFVEQELEDGDFPELTQQREVLSDEEFDEFIENEWCYSDPSFYGRQPYRATNILSPEFNNDVDGDWSDIRPTTDEARIVTEGRIQYRESLPGLQGDIPSTAVLFVMIAVLIGASFVGAEYKFGTLENLLLWEPNRLRVLWTKFAAGFVSSAILTAIMLTFASGMLLLVAELRGTTAGLDARFWKDLASTIGRASLVGGLFFILSMSIAVIAKNTTAAVGAILGWFVISNIVVELLARWFRRWELFSNATSFISEGDAVKYQEISGDSITVYGHGYLMAGLLVAAWALLFAGLATVLFVRRDVD